MAFENVNVLKARSALMSLKNSLNTTKEQAIYASICNENNWMTLAKEPLKKALKQLLDVHYQELSDLIDTYQKVVDYIEEYHNLETEIQELEIEINDEENEEDPSYSKIKRKMRKQRQCEEKMEEIVSIVDSMI